MRSRMLRSRTFRLKADTTDVRKLLPADRAERPCGLFAHARVGVLEAFRQRGDGAVVADRAESPRRLFADTGRGIGEGAEQPIDGAAVADGAKCPRDLFADA